MAAKPIALSGLCALGFALATWLAVSSRSAPLGSLGSAQAARCKVVVKKVHGHRKKVRKCRPSHPTPTPPLFNGPSDLVVDGHGNVLVADQGNRRIVTLSPEGKLLSTWTKAGTNPAVFQQLYGIALDQAGDVYVTDRVNHVVDKLDPAGQPLAQWSTEAAEPNSFPTLLAVTSTGDLFVSDHTAGAVLDLSSGGAFLGEIGKGDFSDPYGVTVGPSGDLYVADFGADRVREFTPDGKQLGVWGDGANGTVALQKPEAIAVDGRGTIYVTEQTGHLVKFDESGRVLADWGESSALPLSDPSGLALDSQGNSYVTEYLGNRVDKLSSAGQLLATWK